MIKMTYPPPGLVRSFNFYFLFLLINKYFSLKKSGFSWKSEMFMSYFTSLSD